MKEVYSMTDEHFSATVCVIFLLFLAVFGLSCGGGGSSSSQQDTTSPDAPATFTVTFNANGGSSIPSVSVNAGETLEQPADPARESFIFTGWYRDNGTFSQPFAFGSDGDTVSADITLHAQWLNDDPAGFAVDDALALVAITYAAGDKPGYVTQNLGLPSSSEGLAVTWSSSNPDAVSANGSVTRPADSNARVILTASVVSGDFRSARSFDLTIIQARSRTIDEAKAHEAVAVEDIELMNESSDNYEISYSDSGEVLRHVDGKFTDVPVHNADDALDAVQSLHELLGIDDPYEELAPINTARDEFGTQYLFRQVYPNAGEKLEVYGRTVMLSANASGDADFLSSSFIESGKLAEVYTRCTSEQAHDAALGHYAGESGLAVVPAETRKVIYSLENFEAGPVIAFLVRVTGTTTQGAIDDTVIVNGEDLSIIGVMSNVLTWTITDSGRDELGDRRNFPVTVKGLLRKHLRDSGTPEVVVYSGNMEHSVNIAYRSKWLDGHEISGYTGMREILKWWRDTFNRNSLNDKGMTVKLITHASLHDNAYWQSSSETIGVGDLSDSLRYDQTRAIGLDTLTHETTHAVIHYETGGLPYRNATGAIDDGYADIFGCLRDKDWRHGWRTANDSTSPELGITYFIDKTQCLRDAREDVTIHSLSDGQLSRTRRYRDSTQENTLTVKAVRCYHQMPDHIVSCLTRTATSLRTSGSTCQRTKQRRS